MLVITPNVVTNLAVVTACLGASLYTEVENSNLSVTAAIAGITENGSKKGKGIETWPNGYIYEGQFNDSKWHGKGTLKFPDGSSYTGEWKNNKMHGKGIFKWSDGKVIKGTWKEGDYVK